MLRRRALLSMPLFAAAGVVHAQTTDWTKVVEAANKQGHLNVMHNIPPPGGDTWFETFRKAYPGITVESTRLGSSGLAQRFTTEYAAGASQTDAIMTLWDDTVAKWQQDGWIRRVNAQRRRRVPSFLAVVQMHAAAGRRSYVTAAMRSPRPPAMVMDTFSCIETCVLLHRDMRAGGTRCGHRTPTAG